MSFITDSKQQKMPRWILLILRLVLGPMWIGTGWFWLTRDDAALSMTQQISGVLEQGRSYGWYEPFLTNVVLPNAGVFAFLVTWGEFLTGISTTLGAATRFSSCVAILIAFNYACLYGNNVFPSVGNWNYVWLHLILLLGAAGRSFGIDYWLHKERPNVPLW